MNYLLRVQFPQRIHKAQFSDGRMSKGKLNWNCFGYSSVSNVDRQFAEQKYLCFKQLHTKIFSCDFCNPLANYFTAENY